jgi:predicted DNA-binding WGR domain protein
MRLTKRTVLHFREGNSDKVYEVDLCETSPNLYVVNFRYGKRGSNLKEGSKTVSAVPLAEANRIFDDLVNSKVKKGYKDVSQELTGATKAERDARQTTNLTNPQARAERVLERLLQGQKSKSKWPLERAIWRAGELKLKEAAPLLINLLGTGDSLRDYCITWSLGWCGDQEAIPTLSKLYNDPTKSDSVRRIACEALLKLSDEETKTEFCNILIKSLPHELRETVETGTSESLTQDLKLYLQTDNYNRFSILNTLYLIDNEQTRPALIEILRTAPLRPNYFKQFRHIFKAAEYRLDAEIFGLIAYRFERDKEMFHNSYWQSTYVYMRSEDGSIRYEEMNKIKEESSKIAYGSKTRTYLRKRVWRTLRRLGELEDTNYVNMAVGVLIPFSDRDAQPVRSVSNYNWQTRVTDRTYWDLYAGYWAFNHILYGNSPRYFKKDGSMAWQCRPPYEPGGTVPDIREESFPNLWNKKPIGLLHLLSESNCLPVHQFAIKALQDCKEFCNELDIEAILMLLGRPYEVTAKFAFDLAKNCYNPSNPNIDLIIALANSLYAEARIQSHQWIRERQEFFLKENELIIALIISEHADTRQFIQDLLSSSKLSDAMVKPLVARLISYLLGINSEQRAKAKDISTTILKSFDTQLRSLGMQVIQDLLAHPMVEVQELGANILLNHEIPASKLPEETIRSLIASPHESIRGVGIKLFGQLPDETLLEREGILLTLATHQLADIQNAVRPIIKRLGNNHPSFTTNFALALVDSLFKPEVDNEDVKSRIVAMLREDLSGWIDGATKEIGWMLTRSKSPSAQDLGGTVLQAHVNDWAAEFTTEEIIALSNHEVRSVREASWSIADREVHRFQHTNPDYLNELSIAVRALDAKWNDSQEFWFDLFRNRLTSQELTPEILISICDSVHDAVQRFGRELLLKYFEEENGADYMLKLSEHPSSNMQLFVTNYLERYAKDNIERLERLVPFFTRLLSSINRARVAKKRVMAFLQEEALKSEQAAQIIGNILAWQSATISVEYRAAAIETMLKIRHTYPLTPLPLQVKEVTSRQ